LLGTAPVEYLFLNNAVFIKKPKKNEDKYKNLSLGNPTQLALLW